MSRKKKDLELEDIYTNEGREAQLESDEINDWEEAFMEGYEGREEWSFIYFLCKHIQYIHYID